MTFKLEKGNSSREMHGTLADLNVLKRQVVAETMAKMKRHYADGNVTSFEELAEKAKKFKDGFMVAKVREDIKRSRPKSGTEQQLAIRDKLDKLAI